MSNTIDILSKFEHCITKRLQKHNLQDQHPHIFHSIL